MLPLKMRISAIPVIAALAVLAGFLTVCLPAHATTLNGITVTPSDSNPLYSETVTLTIQPHPLSAVFPAGSTVNVYEDSDPPATTPPTPPIPPSPGTYGILLNYSYNDIDQQGEVVPISTNPQKALWSTTFMGGQHTVYAVLSDSSGHVLFTSAPITITVTSALAVPSQGSVYLGMAPIGFTGNPPYQPPPTPTITNIEASLGHPLGIVTSYYSYSTKNPGNGNSWHKLADDYNPQTKVFTPDVNLEYVISNHIIPLISWGCDADPNDESGAGSDGTDADIAAAFRAETQGASLTTSQTNEISVIRKSADALKTIPGPVMVRWTWEFNGFWANHAVCAGASSQDGWTSGPEQNFVQAWRAIWGIFQQEGATNVVFVWNPQHYTEGEDGPNQTADPHPFYPGNTFVDWIGVDSYEKLTSPDLHGTQPDFYDEFNPWYADFSQSQYGNKPMLIGETGTLGYPENPNKYTQQEQVELQAAYIDDVVSNLASGYPLLAAYDWFDVGGYELDAQNPGGLTKMEHMAQSDTNAPIFYHNSIKASTAYQTSPAPTGGSYVMNLNLTNTGLLPLTSVKIDSITNITPYPSTDQAPTGPSPGSFPNLSAGQTAAGTVTFSNWPSGTDCVGMTINYKATKSDDTGGTLATYSGQNTIYVSPKNTTCNSQTK